MKASESTLEEYTILPSGLKDLDASFGLGGIPSKKIIEFSGIWSVGKTTLALQFVSSAQKNNMPCLWMDAEFQWSNTYATALGVDSSSLDFIQEHFAEDSLNQVEKWATENKNGLIVIDAIGAMLSQEEAEKEAGSRSIGLQARLVSAFCRRMVPIIAINNHILLVLNHQFTDVMTGRLKTGGGAKLEHARSIWMSMRRLKSITNGVLIECQIRKNKVAPTESTKCLLKMKFGEGFSGYVEKKKLT